MGDDIIQWCSFCCGAPADGFVTGKWEEDDSEVTLPACFDCYQSLTDS